MNDLKNKQAKYLLVSNKHCLVEKSEEGKEKIYQKIEHDLKQSLLSENLIVLTGAGSSIGKNAGKTMEGLWDVVCATKEVVGNKDEFKFYDVQKMLTSKPEDEDFIKNKNLEELLSRLQTEKNYKQNKKEACPEIEQAISSIESIIKKECTFKLSENFPHENFLRKLLKARKKTNPRIKIFTLNYDTCFEEAGDKIGAVVNDGFSFSQGGRFRSSNFDLDIVYREQTRIHNEENFYDKVFHLYKIHGSVNWEEKEGEIYKNKNPEKALLIYPNFSKYEHSYQMPFFEMISRLQVSLRTHNTTLFIIGYGFNDNHINRIIEEALRTNINLQVFVINTSIKKEDKKAPFREKLFEFAKKNSGLILIADNFENFTNNLPNVDFPEKEDERNFKSKYENQSI